MSIHRESEPTTASEPDPFHHFSAKLSRQAALFFAGSLFSVGLGYLFRIWLGRVIGAEGLGIYALALRLVELCAVVAGLGLPVALARYVAVYQGMGRRDGIRGLLLAALGVSTLGALVLAMAVAGLRQPLAHSLFATPALATYLSLCALLIPLTTWGELFGQYLRGHQEVGRRTVIRHFVRLPVVIAVTVVLFARGGGLMAYFLGEVSGQVVAVVLLAVFAARLTPPAGGAASAPALDREVRSFAGSMLALDALRFVSARVDVVILGLLLSARQVGIYAMALTTAAFVPALLRALGSIFGPIISSLHARGERALLARLVHTSTKWCLALTFPLAVCLVLFANPMMGLFGADFRAGAGTLVLLVVGQLIHVATGSVGQLLTMSGHQRAELWSVGLAAMLGLGLQLVFIPRWGIEGAALALALALAAANGMRVVLVRRWLGLWPYPRRALVLLVPTLASAGAALVVRMSWPGGPSPIAFVVATGAAYLVLFVAAAPALDGDDRRLLAAAGQRVRGWLRRPSPPRNLEG